MRYNFRTIFIVLSVSVILLSGCTTKYEQEDIHKYIQETYGLKDVTVSRERIEIVDEEGYTDYIWEVTADGIKFRVLDNYCWGMESVTNYLRDDYENVMLKKYYDENLLPHFTFDEKIENGLYQNKLVGTFSTKEELIQLYEELENFHASVKTSHTIKDGFFYHLQMQTPIRNNIPNYEMEDGDSSGSIADVTEEKVQEAITKYTQTYIDYHFKDIYEKFTEEEIKETVSVSKYQIAILKADDMFFYGDLCASQLGRGISFGALYEILKREGFYVSGDSEHYTFAGADQDIYEISYDFINADGGNDETNHYYYLKNGVSVPMDVNFYNHFTVDQIEEMCGLKLYLSKPEW